MIKKKPGRKKSETSNKVVKLEQKQAEKTVQDFNGIITKIKIKKNVPEIHFKKDNEKATAETIFVGKEIPLDDFLSALQDLKDFFLEVTELENKKELAKICGISLSEKGVIITGQYETENGLKCPVTLNSQLIKFEKNAGGYEMSQETKSKIEKLKSEAVRYMNGDVAAKQTSLFEEAE